MRNIPNILNQFKLTWTNELSQQSIAQACREVDMKFNESTLSPFVTIQLFLLQILHGNTAIEHLSHLSGMTFSAAAYCKARARIKLEVFQILLKRSVEQLQQGTFDTSRWCGHRVFHVDGSSFSMSDTMELQNHFGQSGIQKKGCGFPTAHWLVMLHAGTGMITKMLTAPLRVNDMTKVIEIHPELQANDLLLGDRGFCSYVHIALLLQRNTHAMFRLNTARIVDFTPGRDHHLPQHEQSKEAANKPRSRWLKQLAATDQIVAWFKPRTKPSWMTKQQFELLPETIKVRELRYQINQKGFRTKDVTLVTTLLDAERYTFSELAKLYYQRWEIETNFKHIKCTMKMDVLKCKTVAGVLKELQMFALVYNMVRQVMLEASKRQQVDISRISFIDAYRWLQAAQPSEELPSLVVLPYRPNRRELRYKKRRPKYYPLLSRPRSEIMQHLLNK